MIDGPRESRDVFGLDRREHRDAELVAAELAVRLCVEDAVRSQDPGDGRCVDVSSKSIVAVTWLRDAGSATNGVACSCASAHP